jgi:1-deoxy-D-xylulose-5-phosphate reductoisomerase
MKRVALLGCTGSIGSQAIEVIRMHPGELQIVALAANTDHSRVATLAHEFKVAHLAMFDPVAAERLSEALSRPISAGMDGLIEIATTNEVDIVVVSVAGMIGLEPTLAAIDAKKEIALASKEVLVAGGAIVMPAAKRAGVKIMPIDSEHSAVLQCLNGANNAYGSLDEIEKIILTASGGPFRGWTLGRLKHVTKDQALKHPTWNMGGKITIDSATLMNKGLEIIEACWLYDLSPEQVEVVIHPQSVIHSIVKFKDRSALAQMGHPDMKLPIQYALFGSHGHAGPSRPWEPHMTPSLTFESYDRSVFICPDLARDAFAKGGVVPAFLNAVNEEAANAFLREEIAFLDIQRLCKDALELAPRESANLSIILQTDSEARMWARSQIGK